MSKLSTGRSLKWIAGAVLAASFASIVPATITDDITPFNNNVVVGLSNLSTNVSQGTITVTVVQANGQTATRSAGFRVAPEARTSVTLSFAARVIRVEAALITDEPDPIGP